jgi:ankyrin repeat protein
MPNPKQILRPESPLDFQSARDGDFAKVGQAIAMGGDPDICYENDFCLLHYVILGFSESRHNGEAREEAYIQTLKTLIDAGANPNIQSAEGYTPLKLAIDLDWPAGAYQLFLAGATHHF